ncbi:S-adenosyl-L-methionine-dependent methyltransferase [Cladorrhinum sp. PSN332]|nr:S-adenosyl-L-methionine-dependent methyltransferase [Cladorrhinum sp. PSN332]
MAHSFNSNAHIVVDDDEDTEESRVAALLHEMQDFNDWWQPAPRDDDQPPGSSLDQDELQEEVDLENYLAKEIAQVIDLTGDGIQDCPRVNPTRSSLGRTLGRERELAAWTLIDGVLLRSGVAFEILHPHPGGVKFFKIRTVIERSYPNGQVEIVLRGWGFARTREVGGELPKKLNEVVLYSNMQNGCADSWERQSLTDVPLSAVGVIRELRVTNLPFPAARFDTGDLEDYGKLWVRDHSPLVCRWRREAWHNPGVRVPTETALIRIAEHEADLRHRAKDGHLLNQWRGGKVPGGSYPSDLVVDLDTDGDVRPKLQTGQKYTAGDVFAGAGGASRGIERAGVRLLFSLDHWAPAASSLRMNFPQTDIHECEVTDFIKDKSIRYCPDILHLSPPCQFWSPAHTVAGKDDEQNIDVLFSCEHLIDKLRPRLFTVEQTFGIVHARFEKYFATLIHGFTTHGYSVRWKVVVLANFGVPQTRKRLIMIGAAPGEKLPPFPAHTHSKDGRGGLPRWVTPKAILEKVRHITDEDNKHHAKKRFDHPKARWDPYKMARTITCGGGQNYHWNGTRDFTKLEYAVLQGFPTWHKFHASAVKRQIGNAFAPSVVRVFYTHLVKWLLAQDGFVNEAADPVPVPAPAPVRAARPLVRPIRIRDNVETVNIVDSDEAADSDELVYLRTQGVPPPPTEKADPIIAHPGERMQIDHDSYDSCSSRATVGGDDEDEDGVI